MSFLSTAKRYLDMSSVALSALELVGDIARGKLGSKTDDAINLLDIISKIVERVKAGFDGKADPADIKAEIAKMRNDLQSGDDAVDAAVDEKFPPGEP
jgi:hypothetical protein